jgi:hypothetical protein
VDDRPGSRCRAATDRRSRSGGVTRDGERFLCLEPVAEPSPVVSLSFRGAVEPER